MAADADHLGPGSESVQQTHLIGVLIVQEQVTAAVHQSTSVKVVFHNRLEDDVLRGAEAEGACQKAFGEALFRAEEVKRELRGQGSEPAKGSKRLFVFVGAQTDGEPFLRADAKIAGEDIRFHRLGAKTIEVHPRGHDHDLPAGTAVPGFFRQKLRRHQDDVGLVHHPNAFLRDALFLLPGEEGGIGVVLAVKAGQNGLDPLLMGLSQSRLVERGEEMGDVGGGGELLFPRNVHGLARPFQGLAEPRSFEGGLVSFLGVVDANLHGRLFVLQGGVQLIGGDGVFGRGLGFLGGLFRFLFAFGGGIFVGEDGDGGDLGLLVQSDDLHALGVAPGDFDLRERSPDDDAGRGDDEQVLIAVYGADRDQSPVFGGHVERGDALGAAVGQTIPIVMAGRAVFGNDVGVFGIADFAIAKAGQDQDLVAFKGSGDPDDGRAIGEIHAFVPRGGAPHRADFLFLEGNEFTVAGGEGDDGVPVGALDVEEAVAIAETNGDFAVLVDGSVLLQGSALDEPVASDEDQVIALWIVIARNDGYDFFVAVEIEDVLSRGPFAGPPGIRDLIAAEAIDFAEAGEEEDVGVRLGVVHQAHHVAGGGLHAGNAPSAAVLGFEGIIVDPLNVVVAGEGDEDVLLRDEVLVFDIGGLIGDVGPPLVPEATLDLFDFGDEQIDDVLARGEEAVVFGDVGDQLVLFGIELVLLHALEAAEGHGQNRGALLFVEAEGFAEAGGGFRIVFGAADDVNDLIDVVVSEDQAFDQVQPISVPLQEEFGPAGEDADLEVNVIAQKRHDAEHLRGPIDQAEVDDAEIALELSVLEQIVGDDFGDHVFAELDDDADALFVGFITHIGDAVDLLGADQIGDRADHVGFVDLVRDLGDDDPLLAVAHILDVVFGADGDGADAGAVVIQNPFAAQHGPTAWEIGPEHIVLDDFLRGQLRVLGHGHDRVDGLREVVRRHVGGHADRDALAPVDQKIREAAGEDFRFQLGPIVVVHEIDRVAIDVADQFQGQFVHPGLGVTHGGGLVAVDVAEVPVPIHEGVA